MTGLYTMNKLAMLSFLVLICCLALHFTSATTTSHQQSKNDILKLASGFNSPVSCILANCSLQFGACIVNSQCRKAADCNKDCLSKPDNEACTQYRNMMQCMSDHGCFPKSPPDGKCLAQDTDTIKNLTNLAQIKGKWWILRGLNCGQPGWPAAFDYFPCQRDEFVLENGNWVDHIAYCGGNKSVCSTPLIYTVANVSITKPGQFLT